MIYVGQQIHDTQTSSLLMVCHVNYALQQAALADMNQAENSNNISKPKIWTFNEVKALIKKKSVKTSQYELPSEFSFSDKTLVKQKKQKNKKNKNGLIKETRSIKSSSPLQLNNESFNICMEKGLPKKLTNYCKPTLNLTLSLHGNLQELITIRLIVISCSVVT